MAGLDLATRVAEKVVWTAACFAVASRRRVSPSALMDCRGRTTRAAGDRLEAHRMAIHLASTVGDLAPCALARATGMTRAVLRHHLAIVEDALDDDQELDRDRDEMAITMVETLKKVSLSPVSGQFPDIRLPLDLPHISPIRRARAWGVERETAKIFLHLLSCPAAACHADRRRIGELRKALAVAGHPAAIVTHPGLGYSISEPHAAALRAELGLG